MPPREQEQRVRKAAGDLLDLIAEAEELFASGSRHLEVCGLYPAQGISAEFATVARLMVRPVEEFESEVLDHWETNEWELAEAIKEGATHTLAPEHLERLPLYTAWTEPLGATPEALVSRLVPPAELFYLRTYLSSAPGLDWTSEYRVRSLTDTCAVLTLLADEDVEHPWFPVPVALIDLRHIHEAVAHAFRESMGGVSWMTSRFDEISASVDAATLYRILLFASAVANEEVWSMSEAELAGVAVADASWGYEDLKEMLDG